LIFASGVPDAINARETDIGAPLCILLSRIRHFRPPFAALLSVTASPFGSHSIRVALSADPISFGADNVAADPTATDRHRPFPDPR
jgi:hypothetical protein